MPFTPQEQKLLQAFVTRLGSKGVSLARAYLAANGGSQTLQEDLDFITEVKGGKARAEIFAPQFWAQYVHDGRPSFQAPPGRYMCYFPDKRDDPRTLNGKDYPVHRRQRQSLTPDEFQHFMKLNRERRKNGQRPIMIVTQRVGPVTKKIPFFTLGLVPLQQEAQVVGSFLFQEILRSRGLLTRSGRTDETLTLKL